MDHQLTPTQAFWLGHLYHAHELGQSLSEYAQRQGLSLADLMRWERRLVIQHIAVPKRHRPARFLAVAVSS
jgi:transposase